MIEHAKRRMRYSIRTLLLWTFVSAVLLAGWTNWWRSARRLRDAHREIASLSDQLGHGSSYLPAEETSIQINGTADSALCWSWRIGVPSGRSYTLFRVQDGIPATGFPSRGLSWGSIRPGLQTLTVGFGRLRDAPGVPWGLFHVLQHNGSGNRRSGHGYTTDPAARPEKLSWLLDSQTDWTVEQSGHEDFFTTFDTDRIVLLRVRAKQQTDDGRWMIDPEPCRGLMLWLEAN